MRHVFARRACLERVFEPSYRLVKLTAEPASRALSYRESSSRGRRTVNTSALQRVGAPVDKRHGLAAVTHLQLVSPVPEGQLLNEVDTRAYLQ
jgi:hypothetical protein